MEQRQIERHLLRARLLITRSAVHRLGFRTMEDVQENRVAFFHECHAVFKKALRLLIDDMLIKDVVRYIFVTVASLRKSRKLWRCVTN
jgi:hypothetical protein